ncbi:hypothetical protein N9B82_04605 [Saprospiraceae bacterium]|nr:hypothetical protein [Saprospiraceae bacterium]
MNEKTAEAGGLAYHTENMTMLLVKERQKAMSKPVVFNHNTRS